MTFGQRVALNVAPLLLRLGLAFVFIYYGASKLFYADMPVQGDAAAYLANAGFIKPPPRPALPMPETTPPPAEKAAPPSAAAGELDSKLHLAAAHPGFALIRVQNAERPAGDTPGATKPAAEPEKKPEATPQTKPENTPDAKPGEAPAKAAAPDATKPEAVTLEPGGESATPEPEATAPAPKYGAADFAEPIRVRRLLGLVLMMHSAAERGDWPTQLSSPTVLRIMAWMAALTEFLGGWLVLLGFLTRVWALGFVGTMCVAMWLTQIAPSIGADRALFGFLPPLQIGDAQNWDAWRTWHLQMILLLSALAVVFMGPGKVSLDAMLFRRPDPDDLPPPAHEAR